MDPADRQFRPQAATTTHPDGREQKLWLTQGHSVPRGGVGPTPQISQAMREMRDIPARVKHMDQLGIDLQIVFPTFFLQPFTQHGEIERAVTLGYNRYMAEITSDNRGRFRWAVVPPLLDMDATVEQLKSGKENGAVGVLMRGFEGDRFLFDPYFDPLYETARDLELAICIHAGNGNITMNELQAKNFFTSLMLPIVSAFQNLLQHQVPQRFPGLKFGFFEAGASWIPFILQQARRSGRAGELSDNPVRDANFFVACESDDDLAYITKICGEDNLVIGTDYGHTDVAAEVDALRNLRDSGNLEPRIANKILDDNARALYSL